MYQRGSLSHNMNPAQRLEVLKKEMEHLAMEKEILKAQTRNLEMEKEVCKLRQGILALQSSSNTGVSSGEVTASKVSTNDEIVVTPRRIVKKSANKSPIQPAFSPPRFIRRYEEPEEDRPPILTPAARMVQASSDLNRSQSKPLKASTFMERKQTKRKAEESVQPISTPPFRLNDSSPESSHQAKRSKRSDLERFNDDDEFDSIDIHANKRKSLSDQKRCSPSKPVKLEKKTESAKSDILTPAARRIKAEIEKKQAEKEAAEKVKQDALKAKKMAKELEKKTTDLDVSLSLQRPQPQKEIDKPTASTTFIETSIQKKETEDEVILTPAAKKVQADLNLKKTVIHRTENIIVTETRKQVVVSPKRVSDNKSENSSSESESKLTPTARAVKELMEAKLQAQKKPSPQQIQKKPSPKPVSPTVTKPASPTVTKPASPVSPRISKPVTPALPETPKSRGVHFAKVEKVHLNKPYVPDKVMTPEKVKGIIKPSRLTRRPLHPEKQQLTPRKSTRGIVSFSQTTVEDVEDSNEEEESSVTNSQTSSTTEIMSSQTSSRSSIKSRGRKRQMDTDSSNDDFSEIEESAVTPQPSKRRRTYNTTPHPVKGRRRSKVAAAAINDDDEDDYADVSDTSDAVTDKPSPKCSSKPQQKRGRKKKAVVVEEIEEIEDEVPVVQDKEEDQSEVVEVPVEKEPVSKKTTKSKTTQLKQMKKGKEVSKNDESNEESEKNEELVISTPTKKRRSSLLSKKVNVLESKDVKSTPTKRRLSSLTKTSTTVVNRVSDDNAESEDSTIGTPSKRRHSSMLPKSSKAASKMADIPEDKSVLTPAQREIKAKIDAKSTKTSKTKKKEDSEDSSPEKPAATVGKKASGSKGKDEKKVDEKPNLTPAARAVLAKMQEKGNGKKPKGTVPGDGNTKGTVPGDGKTKGTVPGDGKTKGTVPGDGKTKGTVPGDGNTDSDASDASKSKRKTKRK